ncbi:DMT family transporter [Nocardioides panacisoli]|uniref:EamA family transporter n=1 Tax=Nocardioides panacisoli TaxID=627624 RepID=UPI001C630039|nr:EamA family transporter [Nocardioides panacisoli]QYJ05569.1 DMT family transporter [Nocardioides panacisoli]
MTHDTAAVTPPARTAAGLGFAALSAVSFGVSGALARPLLDSGWSPGAVVLVRIALGALVVVPFGLAALRGRWGLLARNAPTILLYGLTGVAGAQFCYFSAVQYLQVGPALLIEFTAPAAVVTWMWLRHGQRPGPVTLAGAAVAGVGLLLVIEIFSGGDFHLLGTAWALGAMVGCAVYFVISADETNGLPPLTLAAGGLVVGSALLGVLAVAGVLPMHAADLPVSYAGVQTSWWLPLLLLGIVTAAVAYTSGIAAGRRLGSRLASFVGLNEVLAAVIFAWLLLGELPSGWQFVGGVLILLGVVAVKAGERTVVREEPLSA